jgi:hypothetical protein
MGGAFGANIDTKAIKKGDKPRWALLARRDGPLAKSLDEFGIS